MAMNFQKPSELKVKPPLLIGLTGMSNGGKTFSALMIAKAIAERTGGEVLGVDTEAGRMSKYGDPGLYPELNPYRMMVLGKPYEGGRIVEIIEYAEQSEAACLVIDSMTDEWEGDGGVLHTHDAIMEGRKDNYNMVAWREAKKPHVRLMNKLLSATVPIIMCFRAREKIKMAGSQVTKQGVMPVCDSRMIYDLTFMLHMDEEKQDGSYRLIKSGYRHESGVFPEGGRIDSDACERVAGIFSTGAYPEPQPKQSKPAARPEAEERVIPVENAEPQYYEPVKINGWEIDKFGKVKGIGGDKDLYRACVKYMEGIPDREVKLKFIEMNKSKLIESMPLKGIEALINLIPDEVAE